MKKILIKLFVLQFLLAVVTGCFSSGGESEETIPPPEVVEPEPEPEPEPELVGTISKNIQDNFNADPYKEDTDGDGLSDEFEILSLYPETKPDLSDTNENGINDANEDSDGDGLSNIQEFELGTHPLLNDTDGDLLSDGDEVNTHQTNPLKIDSDEDGITDFDEIALNLLPNNPNDSSEITTNTAIVDEAKLEVTGDGFLSKEIKISLIDNGVFGNAPGIISKPIEIIIDDESVSKIKNASISLSYDYNVHLSDEINIFGFDELNGLWLPVVEHSSLSFDESNGVVTANLPLLSSLSINRRTKQSNEELETNTTFALGDYSKFALFNIEQWKSYYQNLPNVCTPITDNEQRNIDLVFVIDSSGSMSGNDPDNIRIVGSKLLVEQLKATDQGAVVDFDSIAIILQELTNDGELLKFALERIDSNGGTSIGAGVLKGIEALNNARNDSDWVIVLLTDGSGDYDETLTLELIQKNIRVMGITLGNESSTELISSISSQTNGIYKHVGTASELLSVFEDLSTVSGDSLIDSDSDGLTDCQEIQGIRLANRDTPIFTDPNNPDTDGDGLLDGDEIGERKALNALISQQGIKSSLNSFWNSNSKNVTRKASISNDLQSFDGSYHKAISDPTTEDSDGDGVSDLEEIDQLTDPFVVDTDGDGVFDGVESYFETDPTSSFGISSDDDYIEDNLEIAWKKYSLPPLILAGVLLDLDPVNERDDSDKLDLPNYYISYELATRNKYHLSFDLNFIEVDTIQNEIIIPSLDGDDWEIHDDYEASLQQLSLLKQSSYMGLFAKGFIAGLEFEEGEFLPATTVTEIIGGLVSGFAGAGNARDVVINAFQLQFDEMVLSIAGLIPVAGDTLDTTKAVAYTQKFLTKYPEKQTALLQAITKSKMIPSVYKKEIIISQLGASALYFLDGEESSQSYSSYEPLSTAKKAKLIINDLVKLTQGTSKKILDNIYELAKNGRVSTRNLKTSGIDLSKYNATDGFFKNIILNGKTIHRGRAGELFAKDLITTKLYPNSISYDDIGEIRSFPTKVPSKLMPEGSTRMMDIVIKTADDKRIGVESKVGQVKNRKFIRDQIKKDCEILNSQNAVVDKIEWLFFPSEISKSVGFNPSLNDLFNCPGMEKGIDLKVFFP